MTGIAPPRAGTLVAALAERVRATPDAPYVSTVDDAGELHTLTFGEVAARARRAAVRLRDSHAVEPGSLVALVPRNDADSVVSLFGVLHADSAALLLDPGMSELNQAMVAAQYGARLLLDPEQPVRGTAAAAVDPVDPRSPAATALVFNTSGSTSMPKAVALSHSALLANAASFTAHHGVGSGDRILTCLPLHHSNAVNTCLISPLVSGGHSIVVPPGRLLDLPKWIVTCAPTILSVVPSLLDVLVKTWRHGAPPPSLRYALTAAAPLTAATVERVRHTLGLRVVQAYGLTETVNFSTTMPVDLEDDDYVELMTTRPAPSVGIALRDVELTVRDAAAEVVPPGVTGEVCMSGPAVMRGYLGNPAETARVLRHGLFHSGDLGHIERHPAAGDLLYLTGRIKNIAKVRGEQVSFEEVEHALRAVPGVLDAGCVAVADSVEGERIIAGITGPGVDPAEVLAGMRLAWPRRMVPRDLLVVDEVPRTPTGKILRSQLRDLLSRTG